MANEVEITRLNESGPITNSLMANAVLNGKLDVGLMRPWVETNQMQQPIGMFVNAAGMVRPVANAILRKEEWIEYDKAVVQASKIRLRGIADLQKRGLTYNLSNGLGTTVLEWEKMSELGAAQMNMDGVPQPNNDRLEFDMEYLPLPIIHKGFTLNIRHLSASRRGGSNIDTSQAYECSAMISDYLENMLFNGASTYTFGGGIIYGYRDAPHRITGSLDNGHWDDLTANSDGSIGEQILKDVLNMKADSISHKKYGPWVLYIPTNFEKMMDQDYVSGYPGSIRERILKTAGIEDIVVADKLAANNVLLVQMTPDTVRLVTGLPLTTVQWTEFGGMVSHYRVMTIQVPQIRADANDNCGIVHYT
jgi:uncharacterized linocin/CFP29 family protein